MRPKLDKFGESEGHLELSRALNQDPWGPGDPQLVHSGPESAPNGPQMEPTRAKEAQAVDHRSPRRAKRVGGQKWTKRAPKMRLKATKEQ